MQNSQLTSNQPISNLTEAELEALIVKIIKKVITQDTDKLDLQTDVPPQAFLNTFGSWEDTHNTEEIIDDIYVSRTIPCEESDL